MKLLCFTLVHWQTAGKQARKQTTRQFTFCMSNSKGDIIRASPGGTTQQDQIEFAGNWVALFATRAKQFNLLPWATDGYSPLSSYQTIHTPSGQTYIHVQRMCVYLSVAVVFVCSTPRKAGRRARGSRCCALSARGRRPNGPSGRPWPLRCQNWRLKCEISAESAKSMKISPVMRTTLPANAAISLFSFSWSRATPPCLLSRDCCRPIGNGEQAPMCLLCREIEYNNIYFCSLSLSAIRAASLVLLFLVNSTTP